MYNSNIPSNVELPSTGKLIKSTIQAAVVAVVVLVTVVLPAEYGIDLTGVGRMIGLQRMGEIKVSLSKEAAAEKALKLSEQPSRSNDQATVLEQQKAEQKKLPVANILTHEMKVTLAPDQSTEIKLSMDKGKQVNYEWWTDGGDANFDIHGDSKKLKINYHGYSKGATQKSAGVLEAAFEGSHGWHWRNRTSKTLTITLKTNGQYTDIKHMQ